MRKGTHHKEISKQKMRDKNSGKHFSPNTEFKKGQKLTKEHIDSIIMAHKGKPSGMKGKHHKEETKKRIAESQRGKKKKPMSEEGKKNISIAKKGTHPKTEFGNMREPYFKGKEMPQETRDRIREKNKGKHSSPNTEFKSGSEHPRYNYVGGRIQLNSLEIGLLVEWSRKIKSRDNWTCQFCGSLDNLNAHHILGVTGYPERIFDLDNGITLCFDCHRHNPSLISGLEFAKVIQDYC